MLNSFKKTLHKNSLTMRTILTFSAILLVSIFSNAQTESFRKKRSLKDDIATRHSSQMFTYNNKLYFMNGYNQGEISSNIIDFWEYDPATKAFRQLPDQDHAVVTTNFYNQAAHVIGNSLYVGISTNSFYAYNFSTGVWTTKAQFPGTVFGGSARTASFVINDTIFAISSSGSVANCYSYNILTNTWTQRTAFPGTVRSGCINFSVNGKGYMGGGRSWDNTTGYTDFYEYNPTTNTWTAKANLNFSTRDGVAAVVDSKAYVGAGRVLNGYTTTTWKEYNPTTDTWADKAAAPSLHGSAAAVLNNDVFLLGGQYTATTGNYTVYNSIYRYNTVSNTWSVDTLQAGGNRSYASTFYHNNKIYVAGGSDGQVYNDTWEYDLTADTWTRKANMPSSFSQRGQAKIGSKLYVVGGYSINSASTTNGYSNELLEYDIATNTWSAKTPFPGGALRNMSMFTINNELYAGLGWSGHTTGLQTYKGLYKYNFTNNTWQAMANCPRTGSGEVRGTFVVADTAYVIFQDGNMWAYNRVANSWSQKASVIDFHFSGFMNNCAFVMNGEGYMIDTNGINDVLSNLKKYNPSTNTWSYVKRNLNITRRDAYNAVVTSDSTFYIGLGLFMDQKHGWWGYVNEYGVANDWYKYNVYADIATKVGDIAATEFDVTDNESYTVYDSLGGIVMGAIGAGISNDLLVSARSADTLLPYREKNAALVTGGPLHNIMFLNKNILIKSSNTGIAGTKIRLFFTNSELTKFITAFNAKYGTNYTENNIRFFRYADYGNPAIHDLDPTNNTTGQPFNYTVSSIVPYKTGKYFEITVPTGETFFGELYAILATTNWALPLSLLNFNAGLKNTSVETQWQTVAEQGFSHFNVQRSLDGKNFKNIAKVAARGSTNGNTQNYSYTDEQVTNHETDKLYYRLQLVDVDGSIEFSPISMVKLFGKNNITISPNPARDQIRVSGSNMHIIQVYDFMGRLLTTVNAKGSSFIAVSIASFSPGSYRVRVVDTDGYIETKTIVKE